MTLVINRVLVLLSALCVSGKVIPAVSELDTSQYTGRWYQISADQQVMRTFERNAVCVTADYALDSDPKYGTVLKVVNSERVGNATDGDLSNVTGVAYFADATKPAELSLKFDPPVPTFFTGSYWVIALGPAVDGVYQYAVISDNLSRTLFVLARNVTEYYELYNSTVSDFLVANGFTGSRAPIQTLQTDCSYAPEPFPASAAKKIKTTVDSYCPGSKAAIHASCAVSISFKNSCSHVIDEMTARIAGQYDEWFDPHNNGTYKILSQSETLLSLERRTGNGEYTDLVNFVFEANDRGCLVSGCSESQVTSILDFGTNHCNLFVLYCGTKDGCRIVRHDLAFSETINSCTDAKTACVSSTA